METELTEIATSAPADYFAAYRAEMLEFVPEHLTTLLDVGCSAGNFGAAVKTLHSEAVVWGIEVNPGIAAIASQTLDRVIVGDVAELLEALPNNYFDCVSFNDSLEHMADPFTVLRKIRGKLNARGVVLASIPNVRYYENLIDLVWRGNWDYRDDGILDRTHLRFFTRRSILNTFVACGYRVDEIIGLNVADDWRLRLLNCVFGERFADLGAIQFAVVARLDLGTA